MIGEFILNILFGIVTGIFRSFDVFGIGNIVWDVTSGKLEPFFQIVRSICYFLPVGTIASIVGLIVAFGIFRVVVRLIRTLWDLLPVA